MTLSRDAAGTVIPPCYEVLFLDGEESSAGPGAPDAGILLRELLFSGSMNRSLSFAPGLARTPRTALVLALLVGCGADEAAPATDTTPPENGGKSGAAGSGQGGTAGKSGAAGSVGGGAAGGKRRSLTGVELSGGLRV